MTWDRRGRWRVQVWQLCTFAGWPIIQKFPLWHSPAPNQLPSLSRRMEPKRGENVPKWQSFAMSLGGTCLIRQRLAACVGLPFMDPAPMQRLNKAVCCAPTTVARPGGWPRAAMETPTLNYPNPSFTPTFTPSPSTHRHPTWSLPRPAVGFIARPMAEKLGYASMTATVGRSGSTRLIPIISSSAQRTRLT